MAKENYIRLRGQLRSDIAYLKNANDEIITAMFPLLVVRRQAYDRAGNLSPKWDRPIIATSDPQLIRIIQTFKKHDIIDVKGTFKTAHSKKKNICPYCGETIISDIPMSTINPVYVGVVNDKLKNDTDGMNYLINCAEIANEAKIIGRVCTPTEDIGYGETERGDCFARYQLAVNRKLFVMGSVDEEDHTDYPIVYSYGEVAETDIQILQQGTLIYLDGYIHTMNYDQPITCTHCNQNFTYKSQRMNLTPYSVEYLRDYEELLTSTHKVDTDQAISDGTHEVELE